LEQDHKRLKVKEPAIKNPRNGCNRKGRNNFCAMTV